MRPSAFVAHMRIPRFYAAFALAAVLSLFAPTGVAPPNFAFNVVILQVAPSGGPQPFQLQPGCAVTSGPTMTYLKVECNAPSPFTCDSPSVSVVTGNVAFNASGFSINSFVGWIPGEFATGSTQCSGGPQLTATAPMPGFAYASSPAVNFGFPWVCEATFSPAATGMVQCSE